MTTTLTSPTTTRRTQAQRRAATRLALVEATVQCLVERGYAATTTRAGRRTVSPIL